MSDAEKAGATANQVADLLELTPRRVQQLAEEGYFPKLSRGRYQLTGCVRGYVRYWRERAEGRHTETDLDVARLEREQLQVRLRQIEVAKAEGRVVETAHHEEVVAKIAIAIRRAILTVPGTWGPRIVGTQTPAEGTEVLRACAEDLLRSFQAVADDLEMEAAAGGSATELPDDFPGLHALNAAGVTTYEQLRLLPDVQAVKGIGPKLAERIGDRLDEAA